MGNTQEISLDCLLGAILEQETRTANNEYEDFLFSGVAVN